MKKILDSVHGYIKIEKKYFINIIDTEYFQRLRRIEQTSTRSIFPSARHDRFIHSLGVFHIGCKIVESIKENCANDLKSIDENIKSSVFESYRIACLLHDIAHAPFSHTFEAYYENKWSNLRDTLVKILDSEEFSEDWHNTRDPSAPHEKMSAIVAISQYDEFIKTNGANRELVARMIIGLKYRDNVNKSFDNAMIELMHGDVIDADGMDYVCRDAWAAGYSTYNVDVERLINAVRIKRDNEDIFHVCYTSKCLNEIEAVLKVKTFQQFFVINHHTVVYEQMLLVKAMESAALYHFFGKKDVEDEKKRLEALHKLCSIDCFYNINNAVGKDTEYTKIKIRLPMDDDFISLMKFVRNDKYIKQWLSRQYDLVPLWKSKAEFYQIFEHLRSVTLTTDSWIFSDDCKQFIANEYNLPLSDIVTLKANPKYKANYANKVSLLVNDEIISYRDLFPEDVHSYEPPKGEFCYIYVPKKFERENLLKILKKKSKEIENRKDANNLQ